MNFRLILGLILALCGLGAALQIGMAHNHEYSRSASDKLKSQLSKQQKQATPESTTAPRREKREAGRQRHGSSADADSKYAGNGRVFSLTPKNSLKKEEEIKVKVRLEAPAAHKVGISMEVYRDGKEIGETRKEINEADLDGQDLAMTIRESGGHLDVSLAESPVNAGNYYREEPHPQLRRRVHNKRHLEARTDEERAEALDIQEAYDKKYSSQGMAVDVVPVRKEQYKRHLRIRPIVKEPDDDNRNRRARDLNSDESSVEKETPLEKRGTVRDPSQVDEDADELKRFGDDPQASPTNDCATTLKDLLQQAFVGEIETGPSSALANFRRDCNPANRSQPTQQSEEQSGDETVASAPESN